jgi:hypothetical protein
MNSPDEATQRLRIEARLHGGVVPVPFLGTTWQQRGGAYWRRRVGAVALFLLLTVIVGFIAAGFTVGIAKGAGAVPAVIYDLTLLPGIWVGARQVGRAPLSGRGGAPRVVYPAGCLAFVIAPFALGVCLAVLGSMFGPNFIGERRAREVTAQRGG